MSAPLVPFYPMTHDDAMQIRDAIIAGNAASAGAEALDEMFGTLIDGTNTTKGFHRWWHLARIQVAADNDTAAQNRYHTLDRFFALLAGAWEDKYYTLRGPDYRVNSTGVHALTPMGDLAGKTAAVCATEVSDNDFDWADEDPMTWYVRFNGLSLADGTMNVLAVAGLDDDFDITGNTAPVYTGRLALWK
ncbi:MAG: hypothetical protein IJ926_03985, partial [Firmicutes bacterium]|nr:hypothetical protein [Bacillota bacterium]